ncbi:MAG: hypothetical protein ACP5QA_11695 [Phycisphaerae bacterium]
MKATPHQVSSSAVYEPSRLTTLSPALDSLLACQFRWNHSGYGMPLRLGIVSAGDWADLIGFVAVAARCSAPGVWPGRWGG